MEGSNGYTIERLRELYRGRDASPRDVIRTCLERIEKLDGALGAFLEIAHETALRRAAGLG